MGWGAGDTVTIVVSLQGSRLKPLDNVDRHFMSSYKFNDSLPTSASNHVVKEEQIEYGFVGKLQSLKYEYRADIRDRAALERNFREKFEALNRVNLSDGEFARLLGDIVTPDVFTAAL